MTTPSLSTPFGRNAANQISISTMYQSSNTNLTSVEHLSFLVITIGSNNLAISSVWFGNKIIFVITERDITLIDGYRLIVTYPLGVGKVVTK